MLMAQRPAPFVLVFSTNTSLDNVCFGNWDDIWEWYQLKLLWFNGQHVEVDI